MTTLDDIRAQESSTVVLAALKSDPSLTGLDTSTAFIHDTLAPVAVLIAQENAILERVAESSTVVGLPGHRAVGAEVDRHVALLGLARKGAVSATVTVRFTGSVGAVIPVATIVSTAGANPQSFSTSPITTYTIPAGGTIDVPAIALIPGSAGNISASAITLLSTQISGISSVTNVNPGSGGLDVESDDDLIQRFLQDAADMPNGVNPAQYRSWARQVAGVGAASVLRPGDINGPTAPGPDVYLVDNNMLPVPRSTADAVQAYIAPAASFSAEAESFNVTNTNGVTTVTDPNASNGQAKQMAYSATAAGAITHQNAQSLLNESGVWTVRLSVAASRIDQTTNLLQFGMWNVTNSNWCVTRPGGAVQSLVTYHGTQLTIAYAVLPNLEYYWNGTDLIELRITRLQTDTLTNVLVDKVEYRSTFSSSFLEGKSTVGHRVVVRPSVAVPISVAVSVRLQPNQTSAAVIQNISDAITAYLKSIALNASSDSANDVIYGQIGAVVQTPGAILSLQDTTGGVLYYDPTTLRVNGGTANITINKNEVATPGTYSITVI
jgi:uncharacterized phage protein gp47/JayE